jgi:hypothetical protein
VEIDSASEIQNSPVIESHSLIHCISRVAQIIVFSANSHSPFGACTTVVHLSFPVLSGGNYIVQDHSDAPTFNFG